MNTESIIRLLDSIYSKKDSFSNEELDSIDVLTINRLDYDGNFLTVDFNDLDYFKNLKEIVVENCILDDVSIRKISEHKGLKRLTICNCDVIEDIYATFNEISTSELFIINSNINLSLISGYYELVYFENMDFSSIDVLGKRLDVSHCEIKDIDSVLTQGFDEIIVSHNQYEQFKDIFTQSDKKVYVREENGQFISKEVIVNG